MVPVQKTCASSVSSKKRTIKEPLIAMSLRLFACGVYTFIHWFILVPLLWNAFTYSDWHSLWFLFYEIIAFVVWLAVIILLLNLKCCEQKETERLPLKDHMSSSPQHVPQFQTSVAHIQPKETTKLHDPCLYQSGYSGEGSKVSLSLCSFPVQPQNTPSKYCNESQLKTSRDSVSLDQNTSDVPNKTAQTTVMELQKSTLSKSEENAPETLRENKISDDDCVFNVPKYDKAFDSLSPKETTVLDNYTNEKHKENVQFLREESFVGLPEMNSFGSYLQLVTVETPFSPGEQFFPDLMKKADTEEAVQMRKIKETNFPDSKIPEKVVSENFSQNDTLSVNSAIEEEFVNRDVKDETKIQTADVNSQIPVCKERDVIRSEEISSDESTEVFSPGAPTPSSKVQMSSKKESLGECFIADVHKTENAVSEVFIPVGDVNSNTKSCDTICVNIVDEMLKHNLLHDTNSPEEGRWAVLK